MSPRFRSPQSVLLPMQVRLCSGAGISQPLSIIQQSAPQILSTTDQRWSIPFMVLALLELANLQSRHDWLAMPRISSSREENKVDFYFFVKGNEMQIGIIGTYAILIRRSPSRNWRPQTRNQNASGRGVAGERRDDLPHTRGHRME